jgi:predicted flap endonuclease-1-like 5' DNA nuclease
MSIPCILIPLLTGLISAYLGYLLGKSGKKSSKNDGDDSLEKELKKCKKRNDELEANLMSFTNSNSAARSSFVSETVSELPFDASSALAALGKKVKQDDLKIVEGIGPKIEELFHAAGIKTWKALGSTSVEKCQQILDAAGERYAIHNPGTWPQQSQMAYEGKWNELKTWQDSLDGGK